MAFLGDPSTRTEEDTCFIVTSFDLDRARVDWENTAIVAWLLAPPSGADRSDVDDVFRRKFRLRSSDLSVSKHFPEEYLVKFSSTELRDQVMRTERCSFKLDGLNVHFRPYRAVSQAFNADLHYCIHMHIDGVPPFAWRPEIVDQIIGRKCAVQRYDDGFTTMEDTSSFGLRVWTPAPHRIPKVLWCTFVNKASGGLSSLVRVAEDRPDQWKRGITFRVLLHVDCIEDFTGAPVLDGGEAISDFTPSSRTLPLCRLGTIDGIPVGSGSTLPASIPPLGELCPAQAGSSRSRNRGAADTSRRSRSRGAHAERDTGFADAREERRRYPSRGGEARHRSRSRHGGRCDHRELGRRRHHEDDEDRDGHRQDRTRRLSTRAPSASSRAGGHREGGDRHHGDGERRRSSRRSPRGHGGHQQALDTASLPPLVF
jgi:hypothetical protein